MHLEEKGTFLCSLGAGVQEHLALGVPNRLGPATSC